MRKLGRLLLVIMVSVSHGAYAEDDPGRCISRQHQPIGTGVNREPAAIYGLEPLVSIPEEGHLKLHSKSTDCCSVWPSPVGDLTVLAGPYDPLSHRLYLWAFDKNGWIEVVERRDSWGFGESGVIEPMLYYPADDIEDVSPVERSEVLGVQFYSGYTEPQWLTGRQSYRVYQISGSRMSRVPELEAGGLDYVGDDLDANLAVFAPAGESWVNNLDMLIWYNGAEIATPSTNLPPLTGLCR